MGEPSFKKVAQLTRETAEAAKQNNEMHKLAMQDVQLKAQYLEIERMKFEADKHADIRHQVNQCVDFALKSLPWWRRSPRTVVDRASELLLMIKRETAKHVAMDVLASKIREESAEKEIPTSSIELEAKTINIDEKGNAVIHATMDREGAEMEIK